MNVFTHLMNHRWILKSEDPKLYYYVKDHLKEIQKTIHEKFGYAIIVTPHLIKMEKIPGKAEIWMGIQEFKTIEEYQILCYILMFLEDKERDEAFVLSSMTEYIQAQDSQIDWTLLYKRRELIRVIKFCLNQRIIRLIDGNETLFEKDPTSEVLYRNTGASRYFLRNFVKDIFDYNEPRDFDLTEWSELEEDRGFIRRQRVYRRLLLSPGIYRTNENDEDFNYLRRYRYQIKSDFESILPCELQIHQESAFINLEDENILGKIFPQNNTLANIILIVNKKMFEIIKEQHLNFENVTMSLIQFEGICQWCIEQRQEHFAKRYQEMPERLLIEEIIHEMQKLGFIEIVHNEEVIIYPIVGKVIGDFNESEDL